MNRQARPALMAVDNPYYSADHPESRDNPRVVEAVVNLREWSVATLAAHGVLDADQVAAAFRFRNAWETVRGARQASIGFSEWIDAGCRPTGLQRAPHGRCGPSQAMLGGCLARMAIIWSAASAATASISATSIRRGGSATRRLICCEFTSPNLPRCGIDMRARLRVKSVTPLVHSQKL